jgi:hypothetical protein
MGVSLPPEVLYNGNQVGWLARLINDETLLGILCRMPSIGWKQWAKDRLMLMHERKEGGA